MKNDKTTHDQLKERVKELNCLYGLSELMNKPDLARNDFFQSVVELIPPAWQYPEATCARLIIGEDRFTTKEFKETQWKQSAEIYVNGKSAGSLEVFYLKEMPGQDEGPFLHEERKLINAFTERLSKHLEHEQYEKAIRENERNLRVTLNSIGDAVITTDVNGRITRLNSAAEKLTGWSFNDAQNQPLEKVFHIVNAQSGKKTDNPVEKALKNSNSLGLAEHTKLISKNNTEYYIADSTAPIKNQQNVTIGVVLVFRDVSEEYHMQEELKASEEKYRTVFENTGTATTILEKDGTISLANKMFAKLSGFSIEEIETKKTWMEFVDPDDLEWMRKQHELRRKNQQAALKEYEFRFLDKLKNTKHIHLYIDIIPGTDKSVASLLDITDKVKNERKLKEKIEELEKFNKVMVGRENKMIELKREVNNLLKALGRPEKYTTPGKTEKENEE